MPSEPLGGICTCHPRSMGAAASCSRRDPAVGVCGCVCHQPVDDQPDPLKGYIHKPLRSGNPARERKKTPPFPGMEEGVRKPPRNKRTKAQG